MSNNPAGAISLPQGGGALSGIGEKFSPDLFTGTGNFTVPIALPPGCNGFQPQLNLVYSTGNGNGPFGLGWNLSIPGVSRKTSDGVPRYNEAEQVLRVGIRRDVFILSGAEDLVPVDDGDRKAVQYRPRTEGLFAHITRHLVDQDDYWVVQSKDGLVSTYGKQQPGNSTPAVIKKPDTNKIFAWKLTETKDPFGNAIRYSYERDQGNKDGHRWDQPLLKQIRYADYGKPADNTFLVHVDFNYDGEERPDPFSDYRAGFEIRTSKLCKSITVSTHTADGQTHSVRKYGFTYQSNVNNGVSLLQQLDIIGYDDEGQAYEDEPSGPRPKHLPPLTFGYTQFEPQQRQFTPVSGRKLPARAIGAPDMELVDLHGSGLPDILEMNGVVRYWRNLGNGRFDIPLEMHSAPAGVRLADPGVQLIDANGDGRTDLLVTSELESGYYPLTHAAAWNPKSFQKYKQVPSFNLKDPEVRLLDLTGDGVMDALRSGTRLECFFNDPHKGWLPDNTNYAPRQDLDVFPNVNFSDPRVKFADMTGDGLQDIVLIHDGKVDYWPNLGYGNWGERISMRQAPSFPYGYDPRRILLGDVDGDGLADIVYVDYDKVTLWLNCSGNAWREAPMFMSDEAKDKASKSVPGTPAVTDMDNLRLVDLNGTGVSGVLWSQDAKGNGRPHMFFLDFTGGQKPYVLNAMDNHMGAVTQVEYRPSTYYYLKDQKKPATRWRTPLPFPVQVVARVEVIDEVSKGKLTTEYTYHHGYWDGAEREFRGFGMVEQRDSETFKNYHAAGLNGDASDFDPVPEKHFSEPTCSKTWFHQGPVGEEFGDWAETDYAGEYWQDDPQLLDHTEQVNAFLKRYSDRGAGRMPSPGNRRIKRDALRTLRGSILRTEVYAQDGGARQQRPYTVTEHAYGLREELYPEAEKEGNARIFFPHLVAQRTTQWERGDDPLTQFAFMGKYDAFGQPTQQTAVAMPRRVDRRLAIVGAIVGAVEPDETHVLATHSRTQYATSADRNHLHNRVAQAMAYEYKGDKRPLGADVPGDSVQTVLRKQWDLAQQVRDTFAQQVRDSSRLPDGEMPFFSHGDETRVVSHTVNHYDGVAFVGLGLGQPVTLGALVRVETLVLTEEILVDAYGDLNSDRRPSIFGGTSAQPDVPPGFGSHAGYRKADASAEGYQGGWYVDTQRQQFDFQAGMANPRGLVLAMRDALGKTTRVEEYEHQLLPTRVKDAAGMETTADYNYRTLQPERMTDANGTSTYMLYNQIGLPLKQFVHGTDALGNQTLGGSDDKPEIAFEYDFLNFERTRKPIFVRTTRRIHHASDNISDETIKSREYSDGYGRLIQTRAQAEELIFGAAGDDVGLPAQPGVAPGPAVAYTSAERVIVSGWQVFDNKGRVIHKYEPFFSQGFDFEPKAIHGEHATLFYDPRGNVVCTLNPDGSRQRVVLGRPKNPQNPAGLELGDGDLTSLDVPDGFEPTPWETYTYDANDLAPISFHPTEKLPDGKPKSLINRADASHHFTPGSGLIDALGRVLCQVQRNGGDPANDWFVTRTGYDLRGNALKIVDAHGCDAFEHSFDLLNRPLKVDSIDAGLRTSVLDAQGNLIEYRDSKGSLARRMYDELNRPTHLWARDDSKGSLTLRERIEYGDEGTYALARQHNTLGKSIKHYDEAGLLEMPEYDFKGNLLEKRRRTIRDDMLANDWLADWSAIDAEDALEATVYQTSSRYDALNRPIELTYPQDVGGQRKVLTPRYNRAGALDAVKLGNDTYVERIAYNARGQRVLIAYGNDIMTRHTYDSHTFRLARMRTERFSRTEDTAASTQTWSSNGQLLQDFTYRYDLAGNITQIDDRTPKCGIRSDPDHLLREFTYDPIYRLLTATGRACKDTSAPRGLGDDARCGFYDGRPATVTQDNAPDLTEGYTETYEYDPAGNMLALHHNATSGQSTRRFGMSGFSPKQWMEKLKTSPGVPIDWGSEGNRLTNVGDENQARNHYFDNNGNLTRQNTEKHHAWDHADRMVGFINQSQGSVHASIKARYLYGSDGMRVKKWVRNQQRHVNTTVYVDGAFEHHHQSDGSVTRENNTLHVMDNQSRIALVRVGAPLDARDAAPRVQYHFGDHLGSSHVVLGGGDTTSDSFINREEYFPYGETSFGSFGKKRYRYSGKERDEESGLCYFGARYLAPGLARWMSCDPAGAVDLINVYIYVRNNPIVISDRYGFAGDDPNALSGTGTDKLFPITPVAQGKKTVDNLKDKGIEIHNDIAEIYKLLNPDHRIYANDVSIGSIVANETDRSSGIDGLPQLEGKPDIFDATTGNVWEIKPLNPAAALMGIVQLDEYVETLNKFGVRAQYGSTGSPEKWIPGTYGVIPSSGGFTIYFPAGPGIILYRSFAGNYEPDKKPAYQKLLRKDYSPILDLKRDPVGTPEPLMLPIPYPENAEEPLVVLGVIAAIIALVFFIPETGGGSAALIPLVATPLISVETAAPPL